MKAIKYIFALLIPAFFIVTGCQKIIEFSDKDIKPILVVNSILSEDSVFTIDLTSTISAIENTNVFPSITNAQIILNDGIKDYTNFTMASNDYMVSEYVPDKIEPIYKMHTKWYYKNKDIPVIPGKKYSLEIKANGFNTIKAETEIPEPIAIAKIDTFHTVTINQNDKTIDYKLKLLLNDPVQKNYYRVRIETITLNTNKNSGTGKNQISIYYNESSFNSNDPVFGQSSKFNLVGGGSKNRYKVFTDQLFNGKEYSIDLCYKSDYGIYNSMVNNYEIYKIELLTLSESLYYYLNTYGNQENSMNDPFSEPVLVYTNIDNGTGIFGSYSTSSKIISSGTWIDELLPMFPTKDDEALFNYIKFLIQTGNGSVLTLD